MPVDSQHEINYTNLEESYRLCVKKIIELKGTKIFYIGASKDPFAVLKDRISRGDKIMSNMYVLCKIDNKKNTERLEDKLMSRFGEKKMNTNIPEFDADGEMIQYVNHDLIEGNNFIYVLLGK